MSDGEANIKQEFLTQLDELKVFIFNRIKPMTMGSTTLRAGDYLILANSYI